MGRSSLGFYNSGLYRLVAVQGTDPDEHTESHHVSKKKSDCVESKNKM